MKTAEQRERLVAIIQHDVRRLDRLISDISAPRGSMPKCRAPTWPRST